MIYTITKIGIFSTGKLFAGLYGGMALLLSIFFLGGGLLNILSGSDGGYALLGFGLFAPFIYAIFGFIFGIIGAFIYNLVAKVVGGLEFEVDKKSMEY